MSTTYNTTTKINATLKTLNDDQIFWGLEGEELQSKFDNNELFGGGDYTVVVNALYRDQYNDEDLTAFLDNVWGVVTINDQEYTIEEAIESDTVDSVTLKGNYIKAGVELF